MNDRKYGHKGYMESDRGEGGRRPSGPRPPRPEGPRGRGADQDKAVVFVCRACGDRECAICCDANSGLCGSCSYEVEAELSLHDVLEPLGS